MARLLINQTIQSNLYKFAFTLDTISDSDLQAFNKFGVQTVDFGGTITDGVNSFTIPSNLQNVPTSFPLTISFDSTTAPFNVNTATLMTLYRTVMTTRITAAFTTLRAITDNFTSQYLTNI